MQNVDSANGLARLPGVAAWFRPCLASVTNFIKVEDTIPASDLFPQPTETPILSILNTQN
jgi:hypothetical protein